MGCLTRPDAEITGRPTHALMPSHIPSNYGYMCLGWEKIGVRLRYASWLMGRDKEKIASLFLLHPFPWVPTHLNLTSIFSHPQKHIPVNRDRVQVCRGLSKWWPSAHPSCCTPLRLKVKTIMYVKLICTRARVLHWLSQTIWKIIIALTLLEPLFICR